MSETSTEQLQPSPLPMAEALAKIYASKGLHPDSPNSPYDIYVLTELYDAYTPEGEYSLITWDMDDSYRDYEERFEQRRQAWYKALGDAGISEQFLEVTNQILNRASRVRLTPEEISGSRRFWRRSSSADTLQLMHALESQLARKYERMISIELTKARVARRRALSIISSKVGRLPGNDVDDLGLEAMVKALASAQEDARTVPTPQQLDIEIRSNYRNRYVLPELRAILGIPEGRSLQKAVRSMTPAYIFTKILSCDLSIFTQTDIV